MTATRITTALFKNRISNEEIPFFRGAMIRLSGDAPLFHNHNGDGFNYAYPLIQYKRIKGCAALIGINQGSEAVESLLGEEKGFLCQLGCRTVEMELVTICTENLFACCDKSDSTYRIQHWLPLNSGNYQECQQAEGFIERIAMLEKILVGNILSFAKGIGIYFDFPVTCRILNLTNPGLSVYKDIEFMNFSAVFRCNVFLPEYVGLGKSASVNNGVVTSYK